MWDLFVERRYFKFQSEIQFSSNWNVPLYNDTIIALKITLLGVATYTIIVCCSMKSDVASDRAHQRVLQWISSYCWSGTAQQRSAGVWEFVEGFLEGMSKDCLALVDAERAFQSVTVLARNENLGWHNGKCINFFLTSASKNEVIHFLVLPLIP